MCYDISSSGRLGTDPSYLGAQRQVLQRVQQDRGRLREGRPGEPTERAIQKIGGIGAWSGREARQAEASGICREELVDT